MPVQTRSMAKKATLVQPTVVTDEPVYLTVGIWGKDWDRFEALGHIDFGDFPKDASWRSHKALFYDQMTGMWSPKMVSKCFQVAGPDNSQNWLANNVDYYKHLARYNKDNRKYDLTNIMTANQIEDLNDLTKEELEKFIAFHNYGNELHYECPEEVDLKFLRENYGLKTARLKNTLMDEAWRIISGFLACESEDQTFNDWANSQQTHFNETDSYYDFTTEDGRQDFVDDVALLASLDTEDLAVDYSYQRNSGLYRIKSGPTFQGTLVYIWKQGIRLIPMKEFVIEWRDATYFQFKKFEGEISSEYDYHAFGGHFPVHEEVYEKIDRWVETGNYSICIEGTFGTGKYYQSNACNDFHAELVHLYSDGYCLEPGSFDSTSGILQLHMMNYHGPDDEFYVYVH